MEEDSLNKFIGKIYITMGIGLIISAFVSFLMLYRYHDNTIHIINSYTSLIIFGFGCFEIALAIIFTLTHSYMSSLFIYILFSLVNGITLSFALLYYAQSSIFSAFISTSVLFFVMAFFGNVTKKDLSGIAGISLMVLLGIIIAGIINIFLGSGVISFLTSLVSIVIFSIFTANDNQTIRKTYQRVKNKNKEDYNKAIVKSAMNLYLDFINLFFSNRRYYR